MMKFRKMSNAGFTAMELMVGLGTACMITFILYGVYSFYRGGQIRLDKNVESVADAELARRILMQDLKAMGPSYGVVLQPDDNGKQFFDYYPDVSESDLGNARVRKITLAAGLKKDFTFLAVDSLADAVPIMLYDPVVAYDRGPDTGDINVTGVITFNSLNKGNYVKNQRPGFWVDGHLLLLDTPAKVRPINPGTGRFDYLVAPRSPVFVGRVSGQTMLFDGLLRPVINATDPQDPSSPDIDTADKFLRRAPGNAGGQPTIRMRPVKLIKYTIEQASANAPAKLVKYTYNPERHIFEKPFAILDKVTQITFERESVTDDSLYFRIGK